jgi:hypothetical protein
MGGGLIHDVKVLLSYAFIIIENLHQRMIQHLVALKHHN